MIKEFEKIRTTILSCTIFQHTKTCNAMINQFKTVNQLRDDDAALTVLNEYLKDKTNQLNVN